MPVLPSLYQTLRKSVTLKIKGYLALMCDAQGIAHLFRHIPKVDMRTNTFGLYYVLDMSITLKCIGMDYFVDGGRGHQTKILVCKEKPQKDSLYKSGRAIVRRNTSAEGRTALEIHRRGWGKVLSTCGDDRSLPIMHNGVILVTPYSAAAQMTSPTS